MIIAVVNSKGGVGKSTLAGNLVAWLHELGHTAVLADCDSQNSSSEWIAEAAPQVRVVRYETADAVLDGLPPLRQEADYVVCDGPAARPRPAGRSSCGPTSPSSRARRPCSRPGRWRRTPPSSARPRPSARGRRGR